MSNLQRIVDKPVLLLSLIVPSFYFHQRYHVSIECMNIRHRLWPTMLNVRVSVQSGRTRRRKASACNQITQLKKASKTKCRSRFVFQRLELQLHVVLPSLHEPSNSRPYTSRRAQTVRPLQVRYPGCGDGLLCQLPDNRRVNNGSIT